ncbi:MAG: Lacal_2735 family protein [Saprospiraceae bacterium]|nr:Lacal_2735 family protein [Saprospiraceae bacterium]
MFFKKDPIKKLEKQYLAKMKEARDIQRSGDVQKAALITAEAEEIAKQIEALKK